MPVADSFNPLMDIGEAKNTLGGPHAGPASGSGSEKQPSGVRKGDGTEALGSAVNVKGPAAWNSTPSGGAQRQPSGIDRFNGSTV